MNCTIPYKKIGKQLLDHHNIALIRLIRLNYNYWISRLTFKNLSIGKLINANSNTATKFTLAGYKKYDYLEVNEDSSSILWNRLLNGLFESNLKKSTIVIGKRDHAFLVPNNPLLLQCKTIEELGVVLDIEN